MIANAATEPHKPQKRPEPPKANETANEMARKQADDIATLREEAADSRACPLYKDATQTVLAKARKRRGSCWSASSPATRKILPENCS
jgi:DNA polymerase